MQAYVIEWETKEGTKTFMNNGKYDTHFQQKTIYSVNHHYLIPGKDDLS